MLLGLPFKSGKAGLHESAIPRPGRLRPLGACTASACCCPSLRAGTRLGRPISSQRKAPSARIGTLGAFSRMPGMPWMRFAMCWRTTLGWLRKRAKCARGSLSSTMNPRNLISWFPVSSRLRGRFSTSNSPRHSSLSNPLFAFRGDRFAACGTPAHLRWAGTGQWR